jgi:hypothetical protein
MGATLALLAASPFLMRREQKPEVTAEPPPITPVKAEEKPDPDEPEGIRLTYGLGGPLRPDHRVLPGEDICVEYVARGIKKDSKGEVNLAVSGELVDQAGKKWTELAASPLKGLLYRDSSMFFGHMSYTLSMQQPPGDYTARARLTDKVTGRSINFEHPVYVLRPEFGVIRFRLTHDEEGKLPAGANLTVGQGFYVHLAMVNFARDGKRVHLVAKVSARDRDGKETTPEPVKPMTLNREVPDGDKIDLAKPMRTIMAGDAFITVEVEDRIAKKTVKYEYPMLIHPPRSVKAPVK